MATIINLGLYGAIYSIRTFLKVQFLAILFDSSIDFLLRKNIIEAKVDCNKIKGKIEHYTKYMVIAYFIKGH